MLAKLAFRNVKRQLGNYLIYFITVSLTVALMFAVNNVIFCRQLQEYAESMDTLNSGLIGITIFISLIVAFVLGYGTSFMLKLRKREFGTYLTLGMTRKNILNIFILETMILCVAALAAGILLGLFLYQGLMGLLTHLMEIDFIFAAYSVKGLVFTVVLVTVVFLLASVTSAIYLNRVSIYQLIHGDRKVEKGVKHPVFWLIVTLISLVAIMGSCVVFHQTMEASFSSFGETNGWPMLYSLAVLAVTVVIFHIGLARSVVNLLLKNRRFCSRGTNTFTLRQLSGKLSANSVMAGALAFLIAFAVIGANVSLIQKVSERASLEKRYPYDISANIDTGGEGAVDLEEAKQIISRYTEIEKEFTFNIYTTGDGYLHSFTPWTGEDYEGLKDSIIKESDFNRLNAALGRDPIELNGGFLILSDMQQVLNIDFSSARLELNEKTYPCTGKLDTVPLLAYYYVAAVVPDAAAEGLAVQTRCASYDLKDGKFDAYGLHEALSYTVTQNSYTFERCDYVIKEYSRLQSNSMSAVFIIGALYMAVVFVFMCMAILALKTLSGLSEDRQRYAVLFRLGTGELEQSKTLFLQTFSFFFLPFALPVLLSIPTGIICARLMELGGYAAQAGEVLTNTILIAAVMTVIYVLYFTATYLIAKRNIIRTNI